jgi:hypothetical protein
LIDTPADGSGVNHQTSAQSGTPEGASRFMTNREAFLVSSSENLPRATHARTCSAVFADFSCWRWPET